MLKIIRSSTFKLLEWKNGGGFTEEILAYPEPQDFEWRMSIAQIHKSGPFSHFNGYRRILVLLDGQISLQHEHSSEYDLQIHKPYVFEGAWITTCKLISTSSLDFNFIYRPEAVKAHMECFSIEKPYQLKSGKDIHFLFVVEGEINITSSVVAGEPFDLNTKDIAQLMEPDGDYYIKTLQKQPARVIHIKISQKTVESRVYP